MVGREENADWYIGYLYVARCLVVALIQLAEVALLDLAIFAAVQVGNLAATHDHQMVEIGAGTGVGEVRGAGQESAPVPHDELLVEDARIEVGADVDRGAQDHVLNLAIDLILAPRQPGIGSHPTGPQVVALDH